MVADLSNLGDGCWTVELFAGRTEIEKALQAVGELLTAEGHTIGIVVVGGAALNLLGVVERTTRDVDVLALAAPSESDRPMLVEPPAQLPDWLQRATREVGRDMDLMSDWLNTGPALQWRQGLPPGLETRVAWRQFSGLAVGIRVQETSPDFAKILDQVLSHARQDLS